jgi:uncharacterized protein (DUF302 family)
MGRIKPFSFILAALLLVGQGFAPVAAAGAESAKTLAAHGKEMAVKVLRVPVRAGVSFDEAVESLKLRANARNFKFVAQSALSKEVEAVTGKAGRRTEIYSFCDAVTASRFIAFNLDFAAFLPCRVAITEDGQGRIWVVSMLMDFSLLEKGKDGAPLPPELRSRAREIIDIMEDMIAAAANGDI